MPMGNGSMFGDTEAKVTFECPEGNDTAKNL